jgi:hypothetical protein
MYINPFWCGVFATILVEIVTCIVFAAVESNKGGKT